MLHPDAATLNYRPRDTRDAGHAVYHSRLTACLRCPLRHGHECRVANQLCSILARPADGSCPNGTWGEKKSEEGRVKSEGGGKITSDTNVVHPSPFTLPPSLFRTIPSGDPSYTGVCARKPWHHEVTAVIPTLNAADRLPLVIELLRLQTVRPFVVVVDTGSDAANWGRIESLRSADVEVHALRINAVEHPSEPVSMAMDLAGAMCRTRFMFCTHDDCFLRDRKVLEYLRDLADVHKVAGHRLTRRPHTDWAGMFGHTCLMLDFDFLSDAGITWSMRRGCRLFGLRRPGPVAGHPNWPDTETGINYLCRLAGITPHFTGTEENHARNMDDLIDHCRSTGISRLYDPRHYAIALEWLKAASAEGWSRVEDWRAQPLPESPPLPDRPIEPRLTLPHFAEGGTRGPRA